MIRTLIGVLSLFASTRRTTARIWGVGAGLLVEVSFSGLEHCCQYQPRAKKRRGGLVSNRLFCKLFIGWSGAGWQDWCCPQWGWLTALLTRIAVGSGVGKDSRSRHFLGPRFGKTAKVTALLPRNRGTSVRDRRERLSFPTDDASTGDLGSLSALSSRLSF